MKKIETIFTVSLAFAAILFLQATNAFAQEKQFAEWIRVQSDNGEFSIEVPAESNYFYDKDGFWNSYNQSNYRLKNMSILNSYHENTLLSFECYEAESGGLKMFIESDKAAGNYSEMKSGTTTIKKVVLKTDKFYSVRQYFNSKKFIYVLTAASKEGETPTIKRFLNSLVFKPDVKEKLDANGTSFSNLKITSVKIDFAERKQNQPQNNQDTFNKQSNDEDKNLNKLVIINKPRPSYIDSARMKSVQGKIQLRLEFSQTGFIPKIEVLKSLSEGLLRQAIFAALRIKFFPKEEGGKASPVSKIVEYSFAIY
jgi:hypothetical protein